MNIHHVALTTSDPERLAEFYGRVFGLAHLKTHREDQHVRSVWLSLGQAILMLERSDAPAREGAGWHLVALAIAPTERDVFKARCLAAGVAIEKETDYSFYVRDPDGNRVGLSHYPEKAFTMPA